MQRWAWPALGLFVLACFWGFWRYGPFDLDEGLYAVALMEMKERGDWVVPTYRGEPFFEKPILFYWSAWLAELVGMHGVAGLRLPSILATISTLALVGWFSKRIGAVMILSVSVLLMGVGRMFMPDPLLILGMTAALFAFWKTRDDPRWHVAAAAGLATAVLAKGPMPLVVFALLGLYCRLRMEPWPKLQGAGTWRWFAIAALLSAVLPWYFLAAAWSEAFVPEFLIKQNLGRLAGGDVMHLGPVWMYIPIVLVGLLPFSLSLPNAWRSREGALDQYLWAYVLIVFVLFSLAGTKLPHYILPIFPPLAVLLDRYLERKRSDALPTYGVFAAIAAAGLLISGFFFENDGSTEVLALKLAYYSMMLGLYMFWGLYFFKRGTHVFRGFLLMAPLTLVTCLLAPRSYWVLTHLDPVLSARVASARGLPIIEYRTGGERERGKTSHPSMQWAIGKNTIAVETIEDLQRALQQGPVAVITRGDRLHKDIEESRAKVGQVESLEKFGDWEALVITPSRR